MWEELRRRLLDRRLVGGTLAAAALVGIAGPFGTFTVEELPGRVLFWSAVVLVSIPIALACRIVVEQQLPRLGFWPKALVVCTAFALLYTPLLNLMVRARLPPGVDLGMSFAEMLFAVFSVALLVNLADFLARLGADRPGPVAPGLAAQTVAGPLPAPVHRPGPPAPADAPEEPAGGEAGGASAATVGAPGKAPALPRLVGRLPPELRAAVLHVTVNDHYVLVRTERGAAQVLLRFADALAELDGVEGRRVHRSHWVARAAVAAAGRDGGRIFLRLHDGTRVPVSRRNLGEIDHLGVALPRPADWPAA